MVLHEGRDLRRPLALVVHCAMDVHVLVEDAQKFLLPLGGRGRRGDGALEVRASRADAPDLGSEDRELGH
jgi:hypothetical protein